MIHIVDLYHHAFLLDPYEQTTTNPASFPVPVPNPTAIPIPIPIPPFTHSPPGLLGAEEHDASASGLRHQRSRLRQGETG